MKKKLAMTFDEDVYYHMKDLAKAKGTSVSAMVTMKFYTDTYKKEVADYRKRQDQLQEEK